MCGVIFKYLLTSMAEALIRANTGCHARAGTQYPPAVPTTDQLVIKSWEGFGGKEPEDLDGANWEAPGSDYF